MMLQHCVRVLCVFERQEKVQRRVRRETSTLRPTTLMYHRMLAGQGV